MTKKIIVGIGVIIVSFIIIQTIRFNYSGRDIQEFKFFNLNNKEVKLKEIFDKKNSKLILYIIPDCESCTSKIQSILSDKKYSKSQVIIISVGLKTFDFTKFYIDNFKNYNVTFLIDSNNTFYRDFGLGFTEEFPTVIQFNQDKNEFERIYDYQLNVKQF
jgi:predicted dithiol-disulfide oxidoreductase (DUF899 family)